MAIIEIRGLTYHYPLGEVPALRGIDLEVQPGEFLAVIGANGSGKSSLCYALSGFIPHFFKGKLEGQLNIAGIDTHQSGLMDFVRRVGLVFQNPFNQISGSKFSVYEEIAFGLENLGVPPIEMRARIDAVLDLTGIRDLADRSPYALSGGQQQRVALASILVMQPQVLILDEPTSQLDPIGSREVFQVIKDLSRQGMTIVMAEHKMEWVAEYADRVLVLSQGEILAVGNPSQVLALPQLPDHGVGISRYTSVARLAEPEGLWPANKGLPVTLNEAVSGFQEVLG